MVKLVLLHRRRTDGSPARAAERLLGHHPAMRRCVVNVVERNPPDATALDGIDELSFDALADARDLAGLLDGVDAYRTTEHVHKAPPAPPPTTGRSPGVKLVCPVVRRSGMSHAEFVTHWLDRHVPLALRHHPGLAKYVTNVVDEKLSASGPDLDGIAELHFPSPEALATAMYDSPDGERVIRADVARFIGHGVAYRVAEYVQK
ncbi:MAG: EthD domain-containing protein [Candidatus Binatia bacterium]